MNLFLKLVFIFFLGSTIGYFLELLYRRYKHGRWINPGFLVGPYLPIYGFGLIIMSAIDIWFDKLGLPIYLSILMIGISMTLLELVVGLLFLKQGVRLWDYRKEFLNFKGIICPYFSFVWAILGSLYIFFIEKRLMSAIDWFNDNISFSFVLGLFFGLIIIDFGYSTKLFKKIRKYAKNNNIDIMYEKLKEHIKEIQKHNKEKYSFLLPFSQTKNLKEYLGMYFDKYNDKGDRK